MADIVKITVFIQTNKVGSRCKATIEFDREEWDSMTDEEKEDACRDVAFNMGEWGWNEHG